MIDYHERAGDTRFTSQMDTFIGLAEDQWTPTLLAREMELTTTLTTIADGSVALPADFYRLRALYGTINGAQTNIPMTGPVAEQGLYPVTTGDQVTNARIMGDTLYLYPAQVQTVTLDYWAQFVGLSSINTTNWIILKHPTLYFYTVNAQACLWMKDFDEAGRWGQMSAQQLDDITAKLGQDYYFNTDLVLDTPTP